MNRIVAAGSVLLCAAMTACGTGTTSSAASKSLTPRVTTGPTGAGLVGSLLTTGDLRSVPGVPADATVTPVNDAHLFQDPDPRTPCGQRLSQPDFSSGAGVTVQSARLVGFEFVVQQPRSTSDAYIGAIDGDSRAGCPPYQTRTNTGDLQTDSFVSRVSLQTGADRQSGAVLRVVHQDHASYVFELVVRVGDRLGVAVLITPSAPAPALLRAFAAKVADRMKS